MIIHADRDLGPLRVNGCVVISMNVTVKGGVAKAKVDSRDPSGDSRYSPGLLLPR